MTTAPHGHGPNPRRVHTQAELTRELDLLRTRAAEGSRKAKVSLEELARLVRLPRSTLHSYVTGQTLPPSEVLDRIVIALGAGPAEQRDWNEAWYRLHAADATRPAETPPAAPCTLPALARGFTGRRAELAALDDLLGGPADGDGVRIAAVCGGPGVGKTALALRWARQAAHRFPDGVLYADLRGYDPAPPLPGTAAAATLLGSLAPDADPPIDAGARLARYRELLAGRGMLVVLDNAVDAEQVRPLLPGGESGAVLVTSRDTLAGLAAREGARRITVPPLPPRDALTLLGSLLGLDRVTEEPVDAVTLVERCAGLPLALRVLAERAAQRPTARLADLARECALRPLDLLAIGGDPRADVRAALSWSYQRLAPATADAFRALGVQPEAEVPVAELEALARAGLVEPSADGRWWMSALLRAYAAELTAEQPRRHNNGAHVLLGQ